MAAYVVIDSRVKDAEAFASFLEQVPAIVKAHGGRYLVRGGATEVIRGGWAPHRLAVIEFDSVQQAKGWQDGPDYADLREMLNRCSDTDVVIVDGV